ncbi:hypothetical protein ACIQUM_33170 [Amycolatopsis azurea]|uniref:hypothetical protein n=1 Tax=Amycolatopsis azurea TaxID=36819 RepID=UPI00380D3996
MTDSARHIAPLLVLVRDDESGWGHLAWQPRDPLEKPMFGGFLHAADEKELRARLQRAGYSVFARYPIDSGTTNYWLAPAPPPTFPDTTSPVALQPTSAT